MQPHAPTRVRLPSVCDGRLRAARRSGLRHHPRDAGGDPVSAPPVGARAARPARRAGSRARSQRPRYRQHRDHRRFGRGSRGAQPVQSRRQHAHLHTCRVRCLAVPLRRLRGELRFHRRRTGRSRRRAGRRRFAGDRPSLPVPLLRSHLPEALDQFGRQPDLRRRGERVLQPAHRARHRRAAAHRAAVRRPGPFAGSGRSTDLCRCRAFFSELGRGPGMVAGRHRAGSDFPGDALSRRPDRVRLRRRQPFERGGGDRARIGERHDCAGVFQERCPGGVRGSGGRALRRYPGSRSGDGGATLLPDPRRCLRLPGDLQHRRHRRHAGRAGL